MEYSPLPTPSRAIYGFVLYLFSWVGLVLYILWAYIPDDLLHALGFYYYPQKGWALAVPIAGCILFILIFYVLYPAISLCITKRLDSIHSITDDHAKRVDFNEDDIRNKSILPIADLDISHVNDVLYG